jgi:hypothetical protein
MIMMSAQRSVHRWGQSCIGQTHNQQVKLNLNDAGRSADTDRIYSLQAPHKRCGKTTVSPLAGRNPDHFSCLAGANSALSNTALTTNTRI